jgi:hypothetical protein
MPFNKDYCSIVQCICCLSIKPTLSVHQFFYHSNSSGGFLQALQPAQLVSGGKGAAAYHAWTLMQLAAEAECKERMLQVHTFFLKKTSPPVGEEVFLIGCNRLGTLCGATACPPPASFFAAVSLPQLRSSALQLPLELHTPFLRFFRDSLSLLAHICALSVTYSLARFLVLPLSQPSSFPAGPCDPARSLLTGPGRLGGCQIATGGPPAAAVRWVAARAWHIVCAACALPAGLLQRPSGGGMHCASSCQQEAGLASEVGRAGLGGAWHVVHATCALLAGGVGLVTQGGLECG